MTVIDLGLPTSRKISNSEVTSWLSCRLQYSFAHGRGITKKETAMPLQRGTLGHLAFQYYIEARLNGDSHEDAIIAGERAFTEAIKSGIPIELVLETQGLWVRYIQYKNGWPEWNLLGTEQALELAVTPEITIPMRYDLMVERISDGKILVGDFKFTYDFWQQKDHDLNGQMPKYIAIMKANGMRVDGGFLEEIRTRPLGKEKSSDVKNLWKRTQYFPSQAKQRQVLKQHISASMEIMEYRAMSPAEKDMKEIPVLNKHGACKYCDFANPCASKLDGGDIELMLSMDYVNNTYGYNGEKDDLL